jgi:hypothetical protein
MKHTFPGETTRAFVFILSRISFNAGSQKMGLAAVKILAK